MERAGVVRVPVVGEQPLLLDEDGSADGVVPLELGRVGRERAG